jgi:hypothetical protein
MLFQQSKSRRNARNFAVAALSAATLHILERPVHQPAYETDAAPTLRI